MMYTTLPSQKQVTQALLQHADKLNETDQWITTKKASKWALSIQGKCKQHYWRLRILKMYACWVPWSLTEYHETVQKEVYSDLFSQNSADFKSSLSQIITGNKTWNHYFEPQIVNRMAPSNFSSEERS
jgi:hypothetical protein